VPDSKKDFPAQRRYLGGARHEASERVFLRRETDAGETWTAEGWTLNVSRGGLRVVLEEPVEVDQVVSVRVGSEASAEAPREGRVVWVQAEADGQIVGIEYLDTQGSQPPSLP
jgi:hypothetical protein